MRFQGDISPLNSPIPSPNTVASQMESSLQINSVPHPNIPSTQSVHLNPNVDMSATCSQRGSDSRQYFHFPDPAYNMNVGLSPETHPVTFPEPREGRRPENNGGSYHVGNKQVVGHFQPRHFDNRLNLQRDPNFIRPILNPLGPTDLMGCQRGRQGLISLPISGRLGPKLTSSAQNISSSHRHQLLEEYHELTKSNQGDLHNKSASLPKDSKLAGSHPPHISQIIPYAKLEPSPLSSSPASSIKNSPTLSHSRHSGLADRFQLRFFHLPYFNTIYNSLGRNSFFLDHRPSYVFFSATIHIPGHYVLLRLNHISSAIITYFRGPWPPYICSAII